MQVYRESDVKRDLMTGARVTVLGYGNQGHAHALNLRDSGANVTIGGREGGEGWKRAQADGFAPVDMLDAVRDAEFIAVLLPDQAQPHALGDDFAAAVTPGATIVFAHGYGVAFGGVKLPAACDVVLVAPKGQGHFLRRVYKEGRGLMCLLGVESDASGYAFERALSYAGGLGCLRAGALATTFREEAVTDMFGEQAVLCGGVPALVKAAFDTLVEAGYSAEVAYIECMHELKIITDLMYSGGITHMRRRISGTAAWGSFKAEQTIVDIDMKEKLRSILGDIESGAFAAGWNEEAASGGNELRRAIDSESNHTIESAGPPVRALMPYLKEDRS